MKLAGTERTESEPRCNLGYAYGNNPVFQAGQIVQYTIGTWETHASLDSHTSSDKVGLLASGVF